jgi:hypothetical protein
MVVMSELGLSRAPWRKSSFSGHANNCVEVAAVGDLVGVRDTADRAGGVLDEDIDLGIGQVVNLGFGDIAAHADGVHLQVDPASA